MKKIFAATLLAMTTLTAAHARADDWANAPAVTKLIAQANKTVVHSKTSARPAAAMPAVQTEVLPEPRIVDASGKDLAQDQNADDTVCALLRSP